MTVRTIGLALALALSGCDNGDPKTEKQTETNPAKPETNPAKPETNPAKPEANPAKPAEKKTRAPIKNESKNGLKNTRGAISMARTNDPDSATSQFFINVVDNAMLDPKSADNPEGFSPDGYAVFGKVVEGMDVVDKIRQVDTGTKRLQARGPSDQLIEQLMQNVPLQDVVIKKATAGQANPNRVTFDTSHGTIVLELDPVKAPITTANFLGYVNESFYDRTIFHRVIGTFMIQGGGFALVEGKGQ